MARKKVKIEPIEGFPGIDKLTVEKSQPLTALWQSDMTLAQFKIMDVYLSRIDPHKPEKRLVRFEKGEIEQLLGVDRIRKDELDKRLDGLWRGIRVDHPDFEGFRKVGLFEAADCTKGKDGLWTIELECTQKAMKYIFNIEAIGYIRYKLRSIVSLRSRYAYVLFVYIEQNRFRKSWEISLDELRKLIGATEKTYEEFRRFREKVLDRARDELLEKTECRFTYTPVKKGRTVTAIRFEVETLPNLEVEDPDQITIEQWQEAQNAELWESAVEKLHLSRTQLDEIGSYIRLVPEETLPHETVTGHDNLDIRRYHYADLKFREMMRRDEKNSIPHKYEYLLAMIKRDTKEEA